MNSVVRKPTENKKWIDDEEVKHQDREYDSVEHMKDRGDITRRAELDISIDE